MSLDDIMAKAAANPGAAMDPALMAVGPYPLCPSGPYTLCPYTPLPLRPLARLHPTGPASHGLMAVSPYPAPTPLPLASWRHPAPPRYASATPMARTVPSHAIPPHCASQAQGGTLRRDSITTQAP